jgi:hypothetical protein
MQGMDTDALTDIVGHVDVMEAVCFKKEDHEMIVCNIEYVRGVGRIMSFVGKPCRKHVLAS